MQDCDNSHPINNKNNQKAKANELDGKAWLRNSISIWSEIKKSQEEIDLKHPAIFPLALAVRLIETFTNKTQNLVFDPFAGIGTTIVAAQMLGKNGIGIELSKKFAHKASVRCNMKSLLDNNNSYGKIINDDANNMLSFIEPESIDFVLTSPPYWDVLNEKRSADYKEIRNYGDNLKDLGKISDYKNFLLQLKSVFAKVNAVMKKGTYACVVVMDIRKKDKFYPFHSDIASFMAELGFIYDDLIIWDRRHEYNNMRPLGYPYVFRVNKAHEYILIFKKP